MDIVSIFSIFSHENIYCFRQFHLPPPLRVRLLQDLGTRTVTLEVNGEKWFIRTPDIVTTENSGDGSSGPAKRREKKDPTEKGSVGTPMPGQIVAVNVEDGDEVKEGQTLFKLSAMKMETEIKAPFSGTITRLLAKQGDSVEADDLLAEIYSDD